MSDEFGEAALKNILVFYEGKRSELIPILQEAQGIHGWLPGKTMQLIADFLHINEGEVHSVASFYNQFRLMPLGRKMVTVCRGTACHIRGAPQILEDIGQSLRLKEGETSPDLEYTLESVACIGCCALAPVVKVNHKIHGEMTRERAVTLFPKLSE
ncbi:respiratory-chain NADH dehydrogenase 24 Kd subunit [delta proteobacterium NaphS2]|nr:respiratory-chain NADH dehydrogenase 24 Kd subunit [delta proteobacterium NaphS2]